MDIKKLIAQILNGDLSLLNDEATRDGLCYVLFNEYNLKPDDVARAIDEIFSEGF